MTSNKAFEFSWPPDSTAADWVAASALILGVGVSALLQLHPFLYILSLFCSILIHRFMLFECSLVIDSAGELRIRRMGDECQTHVDQILRLEHLKSHQREFLTLIFRNPEISPIELNSNQPGFREFFVYLCHNGDCGSRLLELENRCSDQ